MTAWYVLACIVPFVAAVLAPWPVFMAASPDSGVGSADAWAEAGGLAIVAGWGLWAVGSAGWLAGASMFREEREEAPEALESWHRTGRAWAIGVAVWGVVATAALGGFLMLGLALSGVSNGL